MELVATMKGWPFLMLQWINEYSGAFSAMFNLAMVLIWLVYFNLMVATYRRQRQTSVIINEVPDRDGYVDCQIVNMSPEPMYLDFLMANWERDGGKEPVRLASRPTGEGADGDTECRRFGALAQGESTSVGHFEDIVEELDLPLAPGVACVLEISAVGNYGPEDLPIGARRRFALRRDDSRGLQVEALDVVSRQVRSREERRSLRD